MILIDDISNRTENPRSYSFLSSDITNRPSLPNVDYIRQLKEN
jgi:hypothetical protein